MLDILGKLQEYIQKEKEKNRQNMQYYYFKEALRTLDGERINEILESDFSLKAFEEQEGPSINKALIGFENKMFDGYLTKRKKIDDSIEIIKQYMKTEKEDLPLEVNMQLEGAINQLLCILEILYQHGADINLDECMVLNSKTFSNEKVSYKVDSPLFAIMGSLDVLKSEEVVNWIFSKPGLDIYKKKEGKSVLNSVISAHSKLSVPVLKMLLEHGVKIDEFTLSSEYGVYIPNEKPVSSLHIGLLNAPEETRKEKLEILYQYATPEQIAIFEEFKNAKADNESYAATSKF